VSTTVPLRIRHADEPWARVTYRPDATTPRREEDTTFERVAELGTEQGNPGNRAGIESIEVALPRKLLEPGITIVDTPGLGGLDSVHGAITHTSLAVAEVVLAVSDTSQPLTASELDFLSAAHQQCGNVVLVQPKVDIQPHWRAVVDENRAILAAHGIDVEIVPVSSTLRQQATTTNSTELNGRVGLPRARAAAP
jgi:hypothetical protein